VSIKKVAILFEQACKKIELLREENKNLKENLNQITE
jgi:hypothetical protein